VYGVFGRHNRDPVGGPCGTQQNTTHGVEVTFEP